MNTLYYNNELNKLLLHHKKIADMTLIRIGCTLTAAYHYRGGCVL